MISRLVKHVPLLTICPTWPDVRSAVPIYVPPGSHEDNIFMDPTLSVLIGVTSTGQVYVVGAAPITIPVQPFPYANGIDQSVTANTGYDVSAKMLSLIQDAWYQAAGRGARSMTVQVRWLVTIVNNAATSYPRLTCGGGKLDGIDITNTQCNFGLPTGMNSQTEATPAAMVVTMDELPSAASGWIIGMLGLTTQTVTVTIALHGVALNF